MSNEQKPASQKHQAAAAPKKKRPKEVEAGPCPKSARHKNTRVYNTSGRRRNCVCDDCGETWVKVGPAPAEDGDDEE